MERILNLLEDKIMLEVLKKHITDFSRYTKKNFIQLIEWLNEYIVPLEKEEITWLNLTNEEFREFLKENYYDANGTQVSWCVSFVPIVLGMKYLNFLNNYGFNYFIGVVPNKAGKKTIVASLCYQKNRIWDMTQERPVNSIQTVEVNAFYRGKGLFTMLASKIKDLLDLEQFLVITDEDDDGIEFHTIERITKILREQGYNGEIFARSEFDRIGRKSK